MLFATNFAWAETHVSSSHVAMFPLSLQGSALLVRIGNQSYELVGGVKA